MRVGGYPASLVKPQTREELIEACLEVWGTGEDWLLLGGGSNIVAADELPTLNVIKVENKGIQIEEIPFGALIRVQAGEVWDDFVAHTVAAGLTGIEALSGIPGTVGAAQSRTSEPTAKKSPMSLPAWNFSTTKPVKPKFSRTKTSASATATPSSSAARPAALPGWSSS